MIRGYQLAVGLAAVVLLFGACSGQAPGSDTKAAPVQAKPANGATSESDKLLSIIQSLSLIPLPNKPPFIDFTLEDLEGKKVNLSDYKGKIILLNFWATWCPPCKAEMPSMEKLYQAFKDQGDLVMLAVDAQEQRPVVQQFISQNKYHFKVLLDTTGQVNGQYSVTAIPTTYLIDRQGRVVAGKAGAHDWSSPAVIQGIRDMLALPL